ncbi:hypothetical protein NLI96_g5722 [Meripilus lineatus]|uniref:Thioredoxin n=1 Tax=Meripilus lineatus TaxID=2056292 RepID=A0AAD5V4B5_9APHY|nr:hypothetical protein NLI96_g5722 [Physisporinus lineatus]
MPVEPITSLAQFRQLIKSPTPVVVDFWATTCENCKAIAPFYETLSSSAPPHVKFYKLDIYDQHDASEEVSIYAMPTFMVFKDGNKIQELVGAYPQKLKDMVESLSK